ncbi:hypothetical protein [Nocardia sp. IFM 10818]
MTTNDPARHEHRALAEREFDAVVYDPGHLDVNGDRRWSTVDGAGAWIDSCLRHAEPGSLVAVTMPATAATSPDARMLRSTLLRNGVLRAIISGIADAPDLWLLRRPCDRPPTHVLLLDAAGETQGALLVWRAFDADPVDRASAPYAVRIVDLLDDRIDLSPRGSLVDRIPDYPALRADILGQPAWAPPELRPDPAAHGTLTLEELVDAEAIVIHEAPIIVGSHGADLPMLTAKDVRLGRPPSRWGKDGVPGAVTVRSGDIAVVSGTEKAVRVCDQDGVLLGSGIQLVRVTSPAIDPRFLAGVLRAAVDAVDGNHLDLYQVAIARIPLAEQRRYAAAFEELSELEAHWHRQRASIERLVRVGFGGLAQGRLRPVGVTE